MRDEQPVAALLEIAVAPLPPLERARALVECLSGWLEADVVHITLSDTGQQASVTVTPARYDVVPVTILLTEPGGTPLGRLDLLFAQDQPPSADLRDRLRGLTPLLAAAISPLRPLSATPRLVGGAASGALILHDGRCLPLPGLDDHALLRPHSEVVRRARQTLRTGVMHRSFLWPVDDAPGPGELVCVTVLGASEAPDFVVGTVLLRPHGDDHGLTPRELEVLGLLVEGCSNQQIARWLGVAQRTVATHVEHVLRKLDAPSRTLAAVRAEREGLHVPPSPGV
jgi:DNA-binding CsgD family transcriptional regulator